MSPLPRADELLTRAFPPGRPPASEPYRLGMLAEFRVQTGEAVRVLCPYDQGTAEAEAFAAGALEAAGLREGPGPDRGPTVRRLRQDPDEWARGYRDGFEECRAPEGLAYASGWIEGEADRLAGRQPAHPRPTRLHLAE